MKHEARPLRGQIFYNRSLIVGTVPTPISAAYQQTDLEAGIDSVIYSLVSTAARSVFWGGANVTVTNGLEIRPGKPIQLTIENTRQLYELQSPIVDQPPCPSPEWIPFVVWDLSTIYLVAAAQTTIALVFFKNSYR